MTMASVLCVAAASYMAPSPALLPIVRQPRVVANANMMAGMALPKGSLVALATPMSEDGSKVDIPTLRELLRWHMAEGTDGVVILGTTGEASVLSSDEKEDVMAATREEIGGKLPIIVGTGTISTTSTIAATKQAARFGADAVLIVTPYYVKPSQAGLLNHFTTIADASEVPIVLYNVPGRTGVDMSVETTVALSRHPKIAGLKDATGDNSRVAAMRAICGDDFKLYSGEDGMARDYVLQGGDGTISVTANVAPASVHRVMAAAANKDAVAAEGADGPLQSLHRDLFCEANPIPVKWALAKMGKMSAGIRSPLAPLGIDFHSRVEGALQQGGCIEKPTVATSSLGWPSRQVLLQGHLFDQSLINQVGAAPSAVSARRPSRPPPPTPPPPTHLPHWPSRVCVHAQCQALDIIEKRGGDFEILTFSVQPNDRMSSEFNFRRTSSVALRVFGVDTSMLDDITKRLQQMCEVLESAEGKLTILPDE